MKEIKLELVIVIIFMVIVSFLVCLDLFGVIKNKYIPAFGYIITPLCTAFVFYKSRKNKI